MACKECRQQDKKYKKTMVRQGENLSTLLAYVGDRDRHGVEVLRQALANHEEWLRIEAVLREIQAIDEAWAEANEAFFWSHQGGIEWHGKPVGRDVYEHVWQAAERGKKLLPLLGDCLPKGGQ